MKVKKQGDRIGGSYEVIKAFPFVIGTLYYAGMTVPGQGRHTCFIHALDELAFGGKPDPETVRVRDESVFFPVREAFVEDGILYQVFRRLEGALLAHRLERDSRFSLKETANIARKVTRQLLKLYDQEQFALVHPQNVLLTSGGALRFLYGGRRDVLPKGAGLFPVRGEDRRLMDEQVDAYMLGALVYRMATGRNPTAAGLKVPPVSRFCPEAPAELDEFLAKALSFDPDKRPGIAESAGFFDRLAGLFAEVEADER